LYDPASNTFSPTGSMAEQHFLNTATRLANGTVLVAAGYGTDGSLASAELYTPADTTTGDTGGGSGGDTTGGDTTGGDTGGGTTGGGTEALSVAIDIKPGDPVNPVNPKSKGNIPVAILSSNGFIATVQVDIATLTFGRTGSEASLVRCNVRNANADVRLDLVCHFDTQKMGLKKGDTKAVLKGKTLDGRAFEASDSVKIVP
jgi:hypothetical protein